MNEVKVIEATIIEPNKKVTKRVCAYVRVSTEEEKQLNSYEAQVRYFTELISSNKDWINVGIFGDYGITGTSISKRKSFIEMINKAKNGNIDLILTKSISRFGRNLIDIITTVNELRKVSVEVFFELENLSTLDYTIDFVLSVLSMVKQEESRQISENVKWSVRKGYAVGKFTAYKLFGYDIVDKKYVINDRGAVIVKRIFELCASGYKVSEIIEYFKNVINITESHIKYILTNERYIGNVLMQKAYTPPYSIKHSVKNKGELPQYLLENNHEPIVSIDLFNTAKTILKNSSPFHNYVSLKKTFTNLCFCMKGKQFFIQRESRRKRYLRCKKCNCMYKNNCFQNTLKITELLDILIQVKWWLIDNEKYREIFINKFKYMFLEELTIRQVIPLVGVSGRVLYIFISSDKTAKQIYDNIDEYRNLKYIGINYMIARCSKIKYWLRLRIV